MLGLIFGKKSTVKRNMGKGSVRLATQKMVEAEWRTINNLAKSNSPSQIRQALISADKTLDTVLKDFVTGQTMGERLKNSSHLFEKNMYDRIWNAHRARNALVHESGYEPPSHIMTTAIKALREALVSLGVKNI